jgi:hypothetical protein
LCFYVVLFCVGRGLCDGLITRPEESYRVSLYVCDQETPKMKAKGPSWTIIASVFLTFSDTFEILRLLQALKCDSSQPSLH